jgi:hypothetical protein
LVPRINTAPTLAPSKEKLDLQVVFTDLSAARAALAGAAAYAVDLDARITLVVAQVVPYPLPLEKPPVDAGVFETALLHLVAEQPVQTGVEIYLCRDRGETLRRVLPPGSAVILSGRKRWWWPTDEQRLASALRRAGHRVIFLSL